MTDTVREKFEARFSRVGTTKHVGAFTEAMFEIYKAGRESMREETIKEFQRRDVPGLAGWYESNELAEIIKELP